MQTRRQFVQSVPAIGAGILLAENMLATAQAQGTAATSGSDATSDPGNVLLFILADAAPVSGAAPCSE